MPWSPATGPAIRDSFAQDATWWLHGDLTIAGTWHVRDAIVDDFLLPVGARFAPGTQRFTSPVRERPRAWSPRGRPVRTLVAKLIADHPPIDTPRRWTRSRPRPVIPPAVPGMPARAVAAPSSFKASADFAPVGPCHPSPGRGERGPARPARQLARCDERRGGQPSARANRQRRAGVNRAAQTARSGLAQGSCARLRLAARGRSRCRPRSPRASPDRSARSQQRVGRADVVEDAGMGPSNRV